MGRDAATSAGEGQVAMADNDSFAILMAGLRAGQDEAAREVFERYAQALTALARQRLKGSVQKRGDPEDVVQSVYRSFFRRHDEGQYAIADWKSLWGLLTVITLRKCLNQNLYHQRKRRQVGREIPLGGSEGGDPLAWAAVAPEPTPEEAAVLTETVERLLGDLELPERQVIELSLQGYTAPEIKQQLGRSERTVRRVREYVRLRLERMLLADA